MKRGDNFFLLTLAAVTFSHATPYAWWVDGVFVAALMAVGSVMNAREARVW